MLLSRALGGLNFNSHAHVERDSLIPDDFLRNIDFNSHAHVERDKIVAKFGVFKDISTHTLTWSVTHLHYSA